MRVYANQIHNSNLGQVVEVEGHVTGILEAYWKDGSDYRLVIGGEEVEVSATESVHVYRDATLGALYRREMDERDRGGVLTEGDLDRLSERLLDDLTERLLERLDLKAAAA